MLQFINKYNQTTFNKNIANIKFTKPKTKKYFHVYLHINTILCNVAMLSRKAFFRSLLIYTNFQYSNLNLVPDTNIFYYPKLVLTYTTAKHSSFLPKKRFIK